MESGSVAALTLTMRGCRIGPNGPPPSAHPFILSLCFQPALPSFDDVLILSALGASALAGSIPGDGLVHAAIVFAWARSPMPVTNVAASGCARSAASPPGCEQADWRTRAKNREGVPTLARFRCGRPGEGLGIAVKPPVLHQGWPSRLARHLTAPATRLKEVVQSLVGAELDKGSPEAR